MVKVLAAGVIGFICGMVFVIVVSCLIISGRLSEEEEREIMRQHDNFK